MRRTSPPEPYATDRSEGAERFPTSVPLPSPTLTWAGAVDMVLWTWCRQLYHRLQLAGQLSYRHHAHHTNSPTQHLTTSCSYVSSAASFLSHAVGTSAGCLMFLRRALPLPSLSLLTVEKGQIILCDFTCFERDWRIFCVYAPNRNTEQLGFFDGLWLYCDGDRQLVLMRDLNCVCDPAHRLRPDDGMTEVCGF